ncbi:hypothetical protein CN163_04445 [Sinorhizobium meliloti]|nr:hypothetical protein CN163_04445 [Sinorhizobium meliloti]
MQEVREPRRQHDLHRKAPAINHGSQARDALGDNWQGWWPDDGDGGGDDSPLPHQPLPEPA